MKDNWHLKLFGKSILKQAKYRNIRRYVGDVRGRRCLDIGADNGVISYLLRREGGHWSSADLDENAVRSIRGLVHDDVYRINGRTTPFEEGTFDTVVIIDFLEHIHTDREFIRELRRITKKNAELIINVPHKKENSLIRAIRLVIGLTDEEHGHVRSGYTLTELRNLCNAYFTIAEQTTYSRFFSELIDIGISFAYKLVSRKKSSSKGVLVTGADMNKNKKMFTLFAVLYPFLWLISKLDVLLFFTQGHSLIVKARRMERR